MKKIVLLSFAACSVMVIGAGCAMCSNPLPNDPTCFEDSHLTDTRVRPRSLSKVTPRVVESDRQFRPIYRAGEKTIGIGKGLSEKEALHAAIANIMETQKCEYVVAVNHITTSKTHPTWRFFCTTNYTVRISGIPVFLERLVEEKITAEPAVAATSSEDGETQQTTILPPPPVIGGSTNTNANIQGGCNCAQPQAQPVAPMALIRLTDIKVDVSAKGVADDNAGVIFPVK